jgi:hypothetical protein
MHEQVIIVKKGLDSKIYDIGIKADIYTDEID